MKALTEKENSALIVNPRESRFIVNLPNNCFERERLINVSVLAKDSRPYERNNSPEG
jgi:hypothetical protein